MPIGLRQAILLFPFSIWMFGRQERAVSGWVAAAAGFRAGLERSTPERRVRDRQFKTRSSRGRALSTKPPDEVEFDTG